VLLGPGLVDALDDECRSLQGGLDIALVNLQLLEKVVLSTL